MKQSTPPTWLHRILFSLGVLSLPWAAGAVLFAGGGPTGIQWWRWLLLLIWMVCGGGLWSKLPRRRRWVAPWILMLCSFLTLMTVRPSADRDWAEDQAQVASIQVEGDSIHVRNIRNFRYTSPTDWTPGWHDSTYSLSDLEAGYFIVEHFAPGVDAIAHTMVSFRFKGDRFLVVSVEIRKEEGEVYSPVRGLFRQFELFYVLADEQDALKLRTHHRESRVAIHQMATEQAKVQDYFMDIVGRVNSLQRHPEFYHTLTSSCTTNLAEHLESVTDFSVFWDRRIYLPGYSSELAWELGLLGDVSLKDAIQRDTVTEAQREAAGADDEKYSLLIRGESTAAP